MLYKKKDDKKRGNDKKKYHRDEVKELMYKYNIDRHTALQIHTGVLSIDIWQERQEKEKESMRKKDEFIENIEKFSPQGNITIENALEILHPLFEDATYAKQKEIWLQREQQTFSLAEQYKIPIPVARSISNKKFSLEDYLGKEKQKETRKQKAKDLHKKHSDIPIETCYKLVDENISIEEYLQYKSNKQKKRGVWYKNYLEDHLPDNEPLNNYLEKLRKTKVLVTFHLYGLKSYVGIIHSYNPYEIKISINKKFITIHKLELKYFCRSRNDEFVLNCLEVDHTLQKESILPEQNPKQRFEIKKKLEPKQKIKVLLGEGEKITGVLDWISKYDLKIKLETNSKISVMVFKHAIVNLETL